MSKVRIDFIGDLTQGLRGWPHHQQNLAMLKALELCKTNGMFIYFNVISSYYANKKTLKVIAETEHVRYDEILQIKADALTFIRKNWNKELK